MRKRQRQMFYPTVLHWLMTEWQNTVTPLLFFRAPKWLPIDDDELLDATTEDPTDLLTSAPADGLLWRNLGLPTKTFAHMSDCAFSQGQILRNVQSLLYLHVYMRACVCAELFPRYCTTPMHARAQSPEATENKGAEGVRCLSGACSLSLCVFLPHLWV